MPKTPLIDIMPNNHGISGCPAADDGEAEGEQAVGIGETSRVGAGPISIWRSYLKDEKVTFPSA